jgi:hypothetical protein
MADTLADGLMPDMVPKMQWPVNAPPKPSTVPGINPVPKVARAAAPKAAMPAKPVAPAAAPLQGNDVQEEVRTGLRDVNQQQSNLAAESSAAYEKLSKELGDMRAQQAKELEDHMASKPPPVESVPFQAKEMGDFSGTLMVLAALGGALTRAPLTASLNNFAAMINGYAQGNQAAFEQHKAEFEANYKKGMEAHKAYDEEFKSLREKHRGDLAALTEAKRDLDARFGKQESLLNDRGKSLMEIQKSLSEERAAAARAATEADRLYQLQLQWTRMVEQNNQFNSRLMEMQTEHRDKMAMAEEKERDARDRDVRHTALAREGMVQRHEDSTKAAEAKLSGKLKEGYLKQLDLLGDQLARGLIKSDAYAKAVDALNIAHGIKLPSSVPAVAGAKPGSQLPPDFELDQ